MRSALFAAQPAPSPPPPVGNITALLATLRTTIKAQPELGQISLRTILAALKEDSFIVILLVFALLLVSPLSPIPLATTVFGLTIASILAQLVLGRRSVWLPRLLLDRMVPVSKALTALDWLEKPARWLDGRLRPRLDMVIRPPLATALKALVCTAALCAPLMELIPASGTSVGAAITLFSAGLLARDGVFVVLGASLAAILPVTLWIMIG